MVRYFSDPKRVTRLQDGIYAFLALGVTGAFMLFLLGSADVMTSLSIIGFLLCLSLVGNVLRFFSTAREAAEITDRQDQLDQTGKTLQHRLNDHDLALLHLAGKVEGLEGTVAEMARNQDEHARQTKVMLAGMRDRMIKLVGIVKRQPSVPAVPGVAAVKNEPAAIADIAPAKPTKKRGALSRTFFPTPNKTANDIPGRGPAKKVAAPISRYEDDIYVSPDLLREAIGEAVRMNRIDVYMQPIATLPQRQIAAYEVYGRVRLKPGVYIPAAQYRGLALHTGQQIILDRLVLSELSTIATQFGDKPILVNLCVDALFDRPTLGVLIGLVKKNATLKNRLVVCISARDLSRMDASGERVITELQRAGIVFGLNDVQGIDLDLNRLAKLEFRFLKLAHAKIMTTVHSDQGAVLIHRFMTRVAARNIHLIVGGVETPDQLRVMLDYPVPFAQGHAFGRPDRPIVYQPRTKVA